MTPYAEALTRYLLRHPLSASLPRKFKIAFEGCAEDHALDADPRHRLARARATWTGGRARVPRGHRRGHGDPLHVGLDAVRVPARGRDPERGGGDRPRVPPLRRLPAQAAQPDEVPDQGARLGALPRGGRSQALAEFRAAGGAALPFDPEAPPVEVAPDVAAPAAAVRGVLAARVAGGEVRGPGSTPRVGRGLPLAVVDGDYARWRRTNVRPQKQAGYVAVTVTLAARRHHRGAAPRAGRAGRRLRRRHRAHHRRPGPRPALGARRGRPRLLPAARGRLAGAARREHDRGRDELPGRGVLPPGGDAVARPRPAARRPPARAARPDRRRGGPPDQDQRLPERLRPAPRGRASASRAASAGSAPASSRSTS